MYLFAEIFLMHVLRDLRYMYLEVEGSLTECWITIVQWGLNKGMRSCLPLNENKAFTYLTIEWIVEIQYSLLCWILHAFRDVQYCSIIC